MPTSPLHRPVLDWYARSARDLPWREPGTSAWAVLVSEMMLQQTPVARVEPVYRAWQTRWPTARALAAAPVADAVRAWGRLGYPRRALRLHAAAREVVARHGGRLPRSYDGLRALPGVGDYTAAAVCAFAYRRRVPVLDTNVRRVLARVAGGSASPAPTLGAAERRQATELLPDEPAVAARWAVAVMELGALVCTARAPGCGECPVRDLCAWRAAGSPAYDGPPRRRPGFTGTDRQVRGLLMAALRDSPSGAGRVGAPADGPSHAPVAASELAAAWPDEVQRDRALAGLVADGLAVRTGDSYRLP